MENGDSWRELKVVLRSLAIAAGECINIDDLNAAYGKLNNVSTGIPHSSFGFTTLLDLIAAMSDVLKTIKVDSDYYAVGLPEPYSGRKLNDSDLSRETRQYDGIITGRTDRRKFWQSIIETSERKCDYLKYKDDLIEIRSFVPPDRDEVLSWKLDLDRLYDKYARKNTSKLLVYTKRELLNLAPPETQQSYKELVEKGKNHCACTELMSDISETESL